MSASRAPLSLRLTDLRKGIGAYAREKVCYLNCTPAWKSSEWQEATNDPVNMTHALPRLCVEGRVWSLSIVRQPAMKI